MVRGQLKKLYSADLEICGEPRDKAHFLLAFQAMIGPVNGEGTESFQIEVCTPSWLMAECADEKAVWGHYKLIVKEYDLRLIQTQIEKYLENCVGETWEDVAEKIGRVAQWEFQDYQQTQHE
jgi:hypothetical protein